MPIEHIGVDIGPGGVRLARVESGFGTVEFRSFEERPSAESAEAPPGAVPPPAGGVEFFAPPAASVASAPAQTDEAAEESKGEEDEDEDEEAEKETGPLPWSEAELRLQQTLSALTQERVFESQFTATSIPTTRITTRLLDFPFSSKKKIGLILQPEFESVTPFDTSGFMLEHIPLEPKGPGVRLLALAAPKDNLSRTLAACRNGGLDPRILGVAGLSLAALPLLLEEDELVEQAPEEEAAAEEKTAAAGEDGEPAKRKLTGERKLLHASPCTGILYLGDAETTLLLLREGKPWLLHSAPSGLQAIFGNNSPQLATRRVAAELRRQILGFEASLGVGPVRLHALGPGAAHRDLLETLAREMDIAILPARLDPKAVGEDAAGLLQRRPEAALSLALALQSAREKRIPAANLRSDEFAFRSRWRDLTEPLFAPALLLVAVLLLYVINSLLALGNYKDEIRIKRAQLAQIYQEARHSAPPDNPVAALQQELDEKRQRLDIFKKISGISILNILAELSNTIKDDVKIDFENFQIESDRVLINGRTANYESVDKITGHLGKSDMFTKVEIRDAVPAPDKSIKFRLSLTLETADEEEEEGGETPEKATAETGSKEEPSPPAVTGEDTASLAPEGAAGELPLGGGTPAGEAVATPEGVEGSEAALELQGEAAPETQAPPPAPVPSPFPPAQRDQGMPGRGRGARGAWSNGPATEPAAELPAEQTSAQPEQPAPEPQQPAVRQPVRPASPEPSHPLTQEEAIERQKELREQRVQERRKEIEERRRMMQERAKARIQQIQQGGDNQ